MSTGHGAGNQSRHHSIDLAFLSSLHHLNLAPYIVGARVPELWVQVQNRFKNEKGSLPA